MTELKQKLDAYLRDHPEEPLADAVYAVLLHKIISFELAPGTKLLLSHLAADFGTSITPIRESIARLEETGLVQINEGKKALVAGYNEKFFRDLQELRYCLESLAAVQACRNAGDQEIDALAEQVKRNIALFDSIRHGCSAEDLGRLINQDLAFHRALVVASGNPLLIAQYEQIYPNILFVRQFFSPFDFSPVEFPDAHLAITRALATRDTTYVRGAIHLHFQALDSAKRLI